MQEPNLLPKGLQDGSQRSLLGISIWHFYQYLSPDQNFCKLGGDIAGVLQRVDFDGVIWDEIWDRLLYSDCREPSHCDRGHSLGIHLTAAHTRDFWARACASFSSDTVPLSAARVWNSNRLSSSLHQRRQVTPLQMWRCECRLFGGKCLRDQLVRSSLVSCHFLIRGNDEDRQAKFPCKWFYNWEPFPSPSSTQTNWNEVQEVSTWICVNSKRRLWQCHGGGKVHNV